jgi:hypothetical protein
MADWTATRPHVYTSGAVILAANHTDNEVTLYTAHNGAMNATTGHTHDGSTGNGAQFPISRTGAQQTTYLAGAPVTGHLWYNTTTNQWMGYNGSAAVILG